MKRRGIDVDESESEDERPREKIVEVVRTAGVDVEDDGVKATVIPLRNKKAERAARGKGVMPRKVCPVRVKLTKGRMEYRSAFNSA